MSTLYFWEHAWHHLSFKKLVSHSKSSNNHVSRQGCHSKSSKNWEKDTFDSMLASSSPSKSSSSIEIIHDELFLRTWMSSRIIQKVSLVFKIVQNWEQKLFWEHVSHEFSLKKSITHSKSRFSTLFMAFWLALSETFSILYNQISMASIRSRSFAINVFKYWKKE